MQARIIANKIYEIKLIARIGFLTAQAEAANIPQLITYSDLINQRLFEVYHRILEIEQQRNMGHNEECGLQMDADEESLCDEESNLARQLHTISKNKEIYAKLKVDELEEEVLNTSVRTLSIAIGDDGLFQRECMQKASEMIALLLESYKQGELSMEQFSTKKNAVNDKLKFFNANTVYDFATQVKTAVLVEPEEIIEFGMY